MFSVPLNPKLSPEELEDFLEFLETYRDHIYDFYFTARIPPFTQDAMGDTFIGGEEDHIYLIELALKIQETFGITASAVFNNTEVRPSQQNLDLFISNFRQLYDAGIRSATIPHTHWMATGQIKAEFPELFVKNTILRNVSEPRDIANLAAAGFDYINLDRDLMRDHEKLLRFKKAKEQFGVKLSLLANEGCLGGCIMMDEHYAFNNTRGSGPQYFNDPISRVSCARWDHEDSAVALKTANFPPWREDWEEFITDYGIDVIKMHGRESKSRLKETMQIIKRYARGDEILFDGFNDFIEETNLVDRPINIWRNKIKNCKFDCWDCGYCDKIVAAKYGDKRISKAMLATSSIVDAVNEEVHIGIPGLTSVRVQSLINKLAKGSKNYLELGTYLGATACAALKDNRINAYLIDLWEEEIQPAEYEEVLPENSKETFMKNIDKYRGDNNVNIIQDDIFTLDTKDIKDIDLMFYDGPHSHEDVSRAVIKYSECLADTAILVFDDANWNDTVSGADEGIEKSGLIKTYSKKMLNSIENPKEWWNGLYIVVVRKTLQNFSLFDIISKD
jgi:predicted O-methyltransferase YrrM